MPLVQPAPFECASRGTRRNRVAMPFRPRHVPADPVCELVTLRSQSPTIVPAGSHCGSKALNLRTRPNHPGDALRPPQRHLGSVAYSARSLRNNINFTLLSGEVIVQRRHPASIFEGCSRVHGRIPGTDGSAAVRSEGFSHVLITGELHIFVSRAKCSRTHLRASSIPKIPPRPESSGFALQFTES
jgi:hypothetical protein